MQSRGRQRVGCSDQGTKLETDGVRQMGGAVRCSLQAWGDMRRRAAPADGKKCEHIRLASPILSNWSNWTAASSRDQSSDVRRMIVVIVLADVFYFR